MAGDWVKIENVTPDKPEVFSVADELAIDPDAVVGKLIRIWVWADQQTTDGKVSRGCHGPSVTRSLIDRLTSVTGFASALVKVGWLNEENGVLTFPNFDRHNGETSKQRALAAKRQAKKRSRNSHDGSVTEALPEKRREESVLPKGSTPAQKKRTRRETSTTEIQAVVDEWNMLGAPFSMVTRIADERREAVRLRMADEWWRANWKVGLSRVKGSSFCRGGGRDSWVADFDWFVRKGTLTKVMEGKYDDRNGSGSGKSQGLLDATRVRSPTTDSDFSGIPRVQGGV